MISPKEKLNRASFTLMETIKDYTQSTVATVLQNARFKLTPSQVQELQTLLAQSIEAGYHRGAAGFNKEVDSALKG